MLLTMLHTRKPQINGEFICYRKNGTYDLPEEVAMQYVNENAAIEAEEEMESDLAEMLFHAWNVPTKKEIEKVFGRADICAID